MCGAHSHERGRACTSETRRVLSSAVLVNVCGVQPVYCGVRLGSRCFVQSGSCYGSGRLLFDTGDTDSCPRLQVGLLYLRYVLNPRKVWEWIEPYLGDHEVGAGLCRRTMRICSGFCCQAQNITIKLASAPLPAMPVQTGFS